MSPRIEPTPAADDLVLLADCDRLARSECYEYLHHEFVTMGELTLADIFEGLTEESMALVPNQLRCKRHAPSPNRPRAGPQNVRWDATACRTAYDAWSFAVNMEDDAETKLVALLSRSNDPRVKLLLMGRISESYKRAAAYRMHRRASYYSERIGAVRAAFPDIRRIQDAGDLALVALAIEKWFQRFLKMKTSASAVYNVTSDMSHTVIDQLERLTEGHTISRRLSKWLDALNQPPKQAEGVTCSERFLNLKLVAEGGRIFDYYDRVFESAEDEETLLLAQSLCGNAAARLKALRAAQPA